MDKYIPFVTSKQCCRISLENILYVEQQGREVLIVTENITYRKYGKLSDMEAYLDERFFYCLKSMTINLSNVISMQNQVITFRDGTEIFLGRQNFVKAKQTFAIYIKKLAIPRVL